MSKSSNDFLNEKYLYVSIFLVGLLLSSISITLSNFMISETTSPLWKTISDLITGFGFTLITAAILAWTVEKAAISYNARRSASERKEIKDNVFKSVYGRFFSEKVLSEFDSTLFASEALKRNTDIDITLQEKSGQEFDGWFQVDYKHSYSIKNITNGKILHPVRLVLELPLRAAMQKMCRIFRVEIDGEVISGVDLVESTLMNTCSDYLTFEKEVEIASGAEINVSFSYQTVKKKEDYELFVMLYPAENIKIRARGPRSIVVRADANNSKNLVCSEFGPNDCHWDLDHGMLPFQSLTIWWKAREDREKACRPKL